MSASSAPTYESTLEHYHLTNEQMQIKCSDEIILALVPMLHGWHNIAPYLEVDGSNVDSIVKDSTTDDEGKRSKLLRRWKEMFGHKATCERLARGFIKSGNAALADLVCEELKKTFPSTADDSGGETSSHKSPALTSASPSGNSVQAPISIQPSMPTQAATDTLLPLESPTVVQQRPSLPTGEMTGEYVQVKIKQFQKRFKKLKNAIRENLENYGITVKSVADALTSLPADDEEEHKQFLESHNHVLFNASNHSELFGTMNFHWNYLSYHLLDHLVVEFDLERLKGEMETYKNDLQRFRKRMPLRLFCQAQRRRRVKPPPEFYEMVVEFDWPANVMLEDVEQFRQEYACHYSLRECAMMLAVVRRASFIITWFIPESIVEKLKEKVPRVILKNHFVLSLKIAGVWVYRLYKNQPPPLSAPSVVEQSSRAIDVPATPRAASTSTSLTEPEYHFVEQPSEEFYCPVTYGLLLQPHLTACCGNHLSQEAVTRIKQMHDRCPLCNTPAMNTLLNKHFQRLVYKLRVFCHHEDRGCAWQGELSNWQQHIQCCPKSYTPLMTDLLKLPVCDGNLGDSTDNQVLMNAVSNDDKAKVEELLSHGADPNAFPIMIQFTPLMEASKLGNVEIAQLLPERGADPDFANNENWTALMAAANNGHLGMVDVLLQKGVNPDMQDHTGWTALMAAVLKDYHDVALRIIEAGATPHIQDHNHTNALLLAIARHQEETVVDALLDCEPELDLQDSYGETALIFACKRKNLKFLKRLLSMGANPNIGNNYGETPVLITTGLREKDILEELLEKYADPNKGKGPPLLVASYLGYEDIADLLMKNGADPDKEDERGVTAFEVAKLMNFKDLANKLNPQQFSSRTPRDIHTLKSLASVHSHISRGPLFLNPDTKTEMQLPHKCCNQQILLWLARRVTHWKFLARWLNLSEIEIRRIECDNPLDIREQCYQMLIRCRVIDPQNFTYPVLGDALQKAIISTELFDDYVKEVHRLENILDK